MKKKRLVTAFKSSTYGKRIKRDTFYTVQIYFLSHTHSVPSASCAAENYSPEQDAVQMKVSDTVNLTTKITTTLRTANEFSSPLDDKNKAGGMACWWTNV